MIDSLQQTFLLHLQDSSLPSTPAALYDPVDYILHLGGKRIRPLLTLMAAEAAGADLEQALPAARAIEVFHNFSLVHDDIMDEAPLRRGKATVHEKWDSNTAILSGDVMLVLAYEALNAYPSPLFKSLTQLFSKTAREVCEGQQYDMDFPQQAAVSQAQYLEMIRLKTAVLLGCALQMGAMIGGLSSQESQPFYDYGILLGLAFQLQDDYLDAFGDPATFGKQVGGDIIENKKTMLYILTMEKGTASMKRQLRDWCSQQVADPSEKVAAVKALFKAAKADRAIQLLIKEYTDNALSKVTLFPIEEQQKERFRKFAQALMERQL